MPYPIIPLRLAYGTQLSYECDVRTLEQQKEPGLLQSRVVPGLNSVKVSVAVNQLVDNGYDLEAFLAGRRGTLPFTFPANAPPELAGKLFKCKEYTINQAGPNSVYGCQGDFVWQMSATFQECFRAAV